MHLDDLLSALGEIDTAGLKKVRSMVSLLMGASTEDGDDNENAKIAWAQIVALADTKGITLPSRISDAKRWKVFGEHADRAVKYMERACGPTDKTGLYAYMHIVARAVLARSIQLRNDLAVPISASTVMQQFAKFEAAIEAQWPGGPLELRFLLDTTNK